MSEYIDRDAFLTKERAWYCNNCDRRKNSKGKTVYEIGEAPCRACDIGTMLDAVEDYPAADAIEELSRRIDRAVDMYNRNVEKTAMYEALIGLSPEPPKEELE